MSDIKHPFGAAETFELTATGDQDITIVDDLTIIDGVTVEATADRTIDLVIDSEIKAGAVIFMKIKSNGTEDTIFGTGITNLNLTGVAGKTTTQAFMFDGTVFTPMGAQDQID